MIEVYKTKEDLDLFRVLGVGHKRMIDLRSIHSDTFSRNSIS